MCPAADLWVLVHAVCDRVCRSTDLEAKERTMEDMRLALTEQEETQSQMEEVLEEKLHLIQELSSGETRLTVLSGDGTKVRSGVVLMRADKVCLTV